MTSPDDSRPGGGIRPPAATPNVEKYVLEADALRRRQLRSAVLHGSRRSWREHRRVWPGVVAGLVVAALVIASTAVHNAFERQQRIDQQQPAPTAPATSGTGSLRFSSLSLPRVSTLG